MNMKVYKFEELKMIVEPIFVRYKIKKAYLFGSYARGEARSDSDIDIMIVKKESEIKTLLNLAEFEMKLQEALKKDVDVIIEETYLDDTAEENKYGKLAKELFYEQVKKDRRVLYDQSR